MRAGRVRSASVFGRRVVPSGGGGWPVITAAQRLAVPLVVRPVGRSGLGGLPAYMGGGHHPPPAVVAAGAAADYTPPVC